MSSFMLVLSFINWVSFLLANTFESKSKIKIINISLVKIPIPVNIRDFSIFIVGTETNK